MFEFFSYAPHKRYIRAATFVEDCATFTFNYWTSTVQKHMEGHLMHVGQDRWTVDGEPWTGKTDHLFLSDFQEAWAHFLIHLKPAYREAFKDEIEYRLWYPNGEFKHCGTLGKEFIL